MKWLLRSVTTVIIFSASAWLVQPALAAELPCRVAKLIVPWSPGGETDIVMRAYANAVNDAGAKPRLQVVNIIGAGRQ